MKKKSFNLIKSSAIISLVMIVTKALSFLRDMLLAQELGATSFSDAVLLSTSLLLTLTSFITSPFAASYLPIATDVYLLGKEKEKKEFFGSVYGVAVLLGLALIIIESVFMKQIIGVLAPGIKGDQLHDLYLLMMLQIPIIPFAFLDGVNAGNLNMLNRFGASEISSALLSMFYIVYLFIWHNNISIYGVAICVVSAYVFAFLIKYLLVRHDGIQVKWNIKIKNNGRVKQILYAMIPFMVADGARELNSLVDKAVASMLDAGSITMQTYASKLTISEVGLIAAAISMAVYSQAAKENTNNNIEGLRKLTVSGLNFVNSLMIPCCVFTMVFRREIIELLFGRGAFTTNNVTITSNTLLIYAIGMFGAGIEDVLTRIMHATKHRKYPAIVSTVTVLINTGLNIALYRPFGIYGLAAASSFVLLLKVPLYFTYIERKIVRFTKQDKVYIGIIKTILVCVCAGVITYITKAEIKQAITHNLLGLLISGLVWILLTFIGYLLIRNEYAMKIVKWFGRKIHA